MNQFQSESADDEDLGFNIDLLGLLRRRYYLIVLGILVGTTLAVFYYVKQVPVYESSLAVLVTHRSGDLTSGTGSSDGVASMKEDILAMHMELFTSPKVLDRAVAKGGLNLSPGQLRAGLVVSKGPSILKASFRDTDPNRAATALQSVYDAYQTYIQDQSRNVGQEAAELIALAQKGNEQALRDADREYREFVASVPALMNVSSSGVGGLEDVHRARLANIESELASLRSALASKQSRKKIIAETVKGRSPDTLTDAEVMSLLDEQEMSRLMAVISLSDRTVGETMEEALAKNMSTTAMQIESQKLLELSSRREIMAATFGEKHPSVKTIDAEMDNLRSYVIEARSEKPNTEPRPELRVKPAVMLAHYYRTLTSDIEEHLEREKELVKLAEQEAKMAKEVEMTFLEGTSFKANLDRAQRRYDEVFKRLQEINLANDYSGFSTDLIVTPLPAMVPVWPAKEKIAAMGILAGAMLGIGLAFLAEMADRTFHDPEEVERVVGASILSHVPRLHLAKLKKKLVQDSAISPMMVTFHQPRCTQAETFRVLRTSILFVSKNQDKKIFLLTSPSPADGKSTTLANLAVSLAQTGKRVLLIDADMRRPTVAETFGIERSPGLSDFLTGDEEWEKCFHGCEQENLALCPAGSRTSQPSELLESERFANLMRVVRESFDIVLIDTPPVLAVADPSIVSGHADGCFLAVRIEKNNRNLVERAVEILREQGRTIDGVIVNSRNSSSAAYRYTAYNYYGKRENGYEATYRRYYEADSEKNGTEKRPSRLATTPQATPINGHTVNGHAVNGQANGHATVHGHSSANGTAAPASDPKPRVIPKPSEIHEE